MTTLDISQRALVPETRSKTAISMPEDVYRYIVAFLDCASDTETILACALVSRTWLPIGQSKLFHSITITTERRWDAFKVLLSPSSSPRIIQYLKTVRELHIDVDRGGEVPVIMIRKKWYLEVLPECSEYLTGVKHISMQSMAADEPEWHSSLSSIPPYSSVEVLEINADVVYGMGSVYRILLTFPNISYLILDKVLTLDEKSSRTLPDWSGLISLTKLEVCTHDYYFLLHLSKLGLARHLKQFIWVGMGSVCPFEWRNITEMIDGPSLLYICCDMDIWLADRHCKFSQYH